MESYSNFISSNSYSAVATICQFKLIDASFHQALERAWKNITENIERVYSFEYLSQLKTLFQYTI